ncbi:hypothetical protein [Pyxidicoccus xibeiensis]|uniref:hypothetical protein n=1 Tax=Pyxidicoccus xibeiensis TaxID=2906759 RepID=UPI0020A72310|nr:hypothetical protein [Pyxidicoccus xibeiensis]MCP3140377.1 hypothetical protein [Pyxidicoccus xibeiensis]
MNIYKGLLMAGGYLTRVDATDDEGRGQLTAAPDSCPPPGGGGRAALRGGSRSAPAVLSGEAGGLACG